MVNQEVATVETVIYADQACENGRREAYSTPPNLRREIRELIIAASCDTLRSMAAHTGTGAPASSDSGPWPTGRAEDMWHCRSLFVGRARHKLACGRFWKERSRHASS